MQVTMIGIDLAKRIFQVCGLNQAGKVAFNKKLRRPELLAYVSQHRSAVVAMESCGSSNYWGRQFRNLGFEVSERGIIVAQGRKPLRDWWLEFHQITYSRGSNFKI